VAEAVQRPTTRFVPAKTNEQLDLQALHRVRSRLVSERTAFSWSAAASSGKDSVSFAICCLTFWPSGRMFFHHAWYASSVILLATGASSISELKP
jgi:chemotaxis methyl-accepting protein methylase